MRRVYYYAAREAYILDQLKRYGAEDIPLDISDYEHTVDSFDRIRQALCSKELSYVDTQAVVNAGNTEKKLPFFCGTITDMQYYFASFDAVVQAVCEHHTGDCQANAGVFPITTLICDKFTVEIKQPRTGEISTQKRYFGRIPYQNTQIQVFGRISFDKNSALIQPMIIL